MVSIRQRFSNAERTRRELLANKLHRNRTADRNLDCPERPCACCGEPFQPTICRRLLCRQCYIEGPPDHVAADGSGRKPSGRQSIPK